MAALADQTQMCGSFVFSIIQYVLLQLLKMTTHPLLVLFIVHLVSRHTFGLAFRCEKCLFNSELF